jgi:hypothetical protein
MDFYKGDIVWVRREQRNARQLRHAAVVWVDSFDGYSDFNGIMLTHTQPGLRFDNILMRDSHFDAGLGYAFDETHFVNQLFTKFHTWGPFHLAGRLTNDGIHFIENQLSNLAPIEFEIYRRR